MKQEVSILKGLHPGIVLDQELKKRKLSKGRFAISIDEFPQTLGAITNGKRNMNTPLALKIEHALGIDEGYFMTLQVFYEIREQKRKLHQNDKPDFSKFRPVLFWETSFEKIDWHQQKISVIERVFERGNEQEKKEVIRFYGSAMVEEVRNNKNLKR